MDSISQAALGAAIGEAVIGRQIGTKGKIRNLMQKHLYFICPTDCLEPIINKAFKQENYYFSSLGNSIEFENKIVNALRKLIKTKSIEEISFVLSSDNDIISDALGRQYFSAFAGLNTVYKQLRSKKEYLDFSWQTRNPQHLILSYYLNEKINKLRFELEGLFCCPLRISGKIYNRKENVFEEIYPGLICNDYFNLN